MATNEGVHPETRVSSAMYYLKIGLAWGSYNNYKLRLFFRPFAVGIHNAQHCLAIDSG